MLDEYCERLGPGLWAEPVNALTNLGFILAAMLLWRLLHREFPSAPPAALIWLVSLVACIGIGSGLYHTFATPWAMWLDVIPILVFQISLLWIYLRRSAGLSALLSSGLMLLFMLANYLSGQVPDWLNGSMMYAPAITSVLLLGLDHARRQSRERWLLLQAFAVFCVSLTLRTLDASLCEAWPMGTHFGWHLLNGLVLYLATRAVILAYQRP